MIKLNLRFVDSINLQQALSTNQADVLAIRNQNNKKEVLAHRSMGVHSFQMILGGGNTFPYRS